MKRALAVVFVLAPLLLLAAPLRAVKIAVAGRVVDAEGKALANAKVSLILVPPSIEQGRLELAGKIDPEPALTAAADAAGAYLLTAPDAGMWKVKIEAPGFVAVETLLLPLLEETDLPEARLSPDVRLEVRLTDPQERPVAGGRVRVEGTRAPTSSNDLWWISPRLAPTDAKGVAVLPRTREEVLTVRAAAPGFPLTEQKNVRSGSAALRLAAGRARQIQVRDPKNKSVPGVLVRLGDTGWPVGFTSEAGLLDLAIPETGAKLRLAATDGRGVDFRLKPAKPEEKGPAAIDLPTGVPVTGKVVSAQDGRALPGALAYPGGDYGPVVRSAADGTFRLPALPAKGGVHVAAAGFFPAWAEGSDNRLPTLALRPRLAASGTVVDEAGKPVAGASLKATLRPDPKTLNDQGAYRSGGFARSGPDGRFRLGGFLAGFAYDLRIDREGFAPARQELPAREPGQPAPELRIVLRAGRVAFGAVIDGSRRPVAGARATLQPAAPADFAARRRAARDPEKFEGSTDAAGRFEVKGLPAGTFDLTVRGRGFAPLTVPGLEVPAGSGRTDLGTVLLAPGASLRGLVTDGKGGPIEGAEVRAQAPERGELPALLSSGKGPADAVTSADGSFVLEDRTPGESLDLSVLHPSYGPGKAPGVAVPSEAPVRIVLQPTSRVSGRATDPDGKPVAGAFVFLSELAAVSLGGQSGLLSSGRFHDGITDDDGSFSLEGVAAGPVRLNTRAPGRQEAKLEGLEVKPGQDLAGLQLVLAPGATVEGRVLSPEGEPVTGAEVVVVEASPGDGPAFSSLRARTDGDGRYRIDGVAPGPRVVEARAEGYQRAVRDVEVSPETRAVDFRLERGLELSGRVVDAAGTPIPSVQLSLIAGDDFFLAPRTLSGPEGAFRFSGLKDGTYRLMARKDGYASERGGDTLRLAGSSVSGIEVKLSAGGTIAGRISGLEPSQLSRVRVWASSELHLGQIDPEGNYRIANLPPGYWRVTAVVPDTPLHAEGRAILEPGAAEARVDLDLGGGHELTGVVLRNGQPLAGASLALTRGGTAGSQTAVSDHRGSFRFGGLEDGTYDLNVGTPNGAQHRESVEISADRRIQVELRTAGLSGRVIDDGDDSPLSGVRISIAAGDDRPSPFSDVTTDSRGAFRLIEVGDGAWTLRASRDGYASAEREVQVDGSAPDEIEIRLSPTEGVTVDALLASGQPPDRIQVAVLGPGGETVATGTYPTGENGRTRVSNVPPGSWRLLIGSGQSAETMVWVTVPSPAVRAILPPAGALSVKVPALAGDDTVVKITLNGSGGPFQGFGWDGRVTSEWDLYRGEAGLPRLPAGSWQVTARAPDGRTWTARATVTPGGTAEVTLE